MRSIGILSLFYGVTLCFPTVLDFLLYIYTITNRTPHELPRNYIQIKVRRFIGSVLFFLKSVLKSFSPRNTARMRRGCYNRQISSICLKRTFVAIR